MNCVILGDNKANATASSDIAKAEVQGTTEEQPMDSTVTTEEAAADTDPPAAEPPAADTEVKP